MFASEMFLIPSGCAHISLAPSAPGGADGDEFSDVVCKALYLLTGKKVMKDNERNHPSFSGSKPMFRYKDLPEIPSLHVLVDLLNIGPSLLRLILSNSRHFYDKYYIEKSNGKLREISAPHDELKRIQQWILSNILEKCQVSSFAKAYKKNTSLTANAKFHCNQPTVVTMDIMDFFPSITIGNVASIFSQMGYCPEVCHALAHLCCLNNVLPQGAPTSPYLSNLRMFAFDFEVSQYIKERSLRYTRYADDITISGKMDPHHVIHDISGLLYKHGFKLNKEKTRIANRNARQEVTGIIVNSYMQISRERRMKIRQHLYYIRKFGLDTHLKHIHVSDRETYLNQLMGLINFSLMTNPNDPEMREYFRIVRRLLNIPPQRPKSLML